MSSNALSVKKLRFFQVPFYPTIRRVLKVLRKNLKSKRNIEVSEKTELVDYRDIRSYYNEIFNLIDAYLFNSSVARDVYIKNGVLPQTEAIISISNSNIRKRNVHRKKRNKSVIAYIGPDEDYKGYFDFIDFVNDIDKENYEVKTYGHLPNRECPAYIQQNGYFTKNNIDTIYSDIDILIVPSKWKETFGLITIEALSYGVKVFVSENVGSKDLLSKSYVFRNKQDLLNKIQSTDYEEQVINTMEEHMIEVKNFYERIINEYKKK
ncbi:glycosyltransferase, group 1 family protein [Streptococcus mitis SK1073]|uniref:Glycosyltransferase, group 1 family protein n=2 Tax=Streptococcus mitis TaxID=28037 RepID=F9HC62_STRMT|nr:glycosyltransferase, group 1 family protein [Streptococcus mitis SK1073]